MNTSEIYVRMTDDEELASIKVRKEGSELKWATGSFTPIAQRLTR